MDHVTYVCEAGQSASILSWYAEIFGMERFVVNSMDTIDDGEGSSVLDTITAFQEKKSDV